MSACATACETEAGSRSELFSAYSTTLDADRSTLPVGRLSTMIVQTDLEYEQTRVKNPAIGRDLNPLGRGDGSYYPDGGNAASMASVAIADAKPRFVGKITYGFGSSMNNGGCPPPPLEGTPPEELPEECRQGALCEYCCYALWEAPAGSELSCCPENLDWTQDWPNRRQTLKDVCCNDYRYRTCVMTTYPPPYLHGSCTWPMFGMPCYPEAAEWLQKCKCVAGGGECLVGGGDNRRMVGPPPKPPRMVKYSDTCEDLAVKAKEQFDYFCWLGKCLGGPFKKRLSCCMEYICAHNKMTFMAYYAPPPADETSSMWTGGRCEHQCIVKINCPTWMHWLRNRTYSEARLTQDLVGAVIAESIHCCVGKGPELAIHSCAKDCYPWGYQGWLDAPSIPGEDQALYMKSGCDAVEGKVPKACTPGL